MLRVKQGIVSCNYRVAISLPDKAGNVKPGANKITARKVAGESEGSHGVRQEGEFYVCDLYRQLCPCYPHGHHYRDQNQAISRSIRMAQQFVLGTMNFFYSHNIASHTLRRVKPCMAIILCGTHSFSAAFEFWPDSLCNNDQCCSFS